MVSAEQIEKWAYDGAPTKVLRALSRAWIEAEHIPQNVGQYRRVVIEPAIDEAIFDAQEKGLLGEVTDKMGDVMRPEQ